MLGAGLFGVDRACDQHRTAFAYGTSRYGWKIYLEIFAHFQVQYFVLVLILTSVL